MFCPCDSLNGKIWYVYAFFRFETSLARCGTTRSKNQNYLVATAEDEEKKCSPNVCHWEWVQHTSLVKYIVKKHKHDDINSCSLFDRIPFLSIHCFVRFNRTFEFWSWQKTSISKTVWEGGAVQPISYNFFLSFLFSLNKRRDQLLARAQQTDWFNNCLNINN